MKASKQSEEYTEAEAQARFEKTLRAALNTPPKPLKDMPRKRAKPLPNASKVKRDRT